jgi:hypothetical protein
MASRRTALRVEEFSHAYLVRGTNLVPVAKQALFVHLGRKRWTRIARMPARPLNTSEFEPRNQAESAVALYFNWGDDCDAPCCQPKDKFKP